MKLFTILEKAWTAFWQNKKYLILTVLVDFIFMFALAQIHLLYFLPSAEAMIKVAEVMGKSMQDLPETEAINLDALLRQNPEFMTAYRALLTNIILFLVTCLGAWLIFKTFAWYLSHKTIYKKIPLGMYATKFILFSLFWFIVIVAILFGFLGISGGPLSLGETTSTIITILLLLLIAYFANISFALIPAQQTFKKTFIFAIKHAKTILAAFVVNLLLLFVTISVPLTILPRQTILGLAIIILITLPSLAFARVNIIVATWLSEKSS